MYWSYRAAKQLLLPRKYMNSSYTTLWLLENVRRKSKSNGSVGLSSTRISISSCILVQRLLLEVWASDLQSKLQKPDHNAKCLLVLNSNKTPFLEKGTTFKVIILSSQKVVITRSLCEIQQEGDCEKFSIGDSMHLPCRLMHS